MLALDRCYCRSWKPATKHRHFTEYTSCLLCNSDQKPNEDPWNVQTQSTSIKRMSGTWWQIILFWRKEKGAILESRTQTQEKVTTTKISSCEMQLLLIWGAEFGRSLLLRNYLGLWVLTHVLFGQWNVFDLTVRIWNAPTPPTPSWRSLPLQKHICSHFIPRRAASEIITADAMRGTGGGSRREGFLFDPSLQLLSLGPKYLLSLLFVFIPKTLRSVCSSGSEPHPSPASCAHEPSAWDHCVLIVGLAGYIGQTAWRGVWAGGLREGSFGSAIRITSLHTSWVSSFNVLRQCPFPHTRPLPKTTNRRSQVVDTFVVRKPRKSSSVVLDLCVSSSGRKHETVKLYPLTSRMLGLFLCHID